MDKNILQTVNQLVGNNITISANDDEGENLTRDTGQTGYMELNKPIATSSQYEERKYGRQEAGDTEGSSNKIQHNKKKPCQSIYLGNWKTKLGIKNRGSKI